VRLDEGLLERARREAARRGVTLTSLIEQGLELLLRRPLKRDRAARVTLPVCRASGGTLPGVDLNDSDALWDRLDAFRSDTIDHPQYKAWLESAISGPAAYGISPQVLSSVARICTHPRIFKQPSRMDDILAFCRVLLELPSATVIEPAERHWSIFESLCRSSRASGNLVQDAWFAALAIESGCEWITTDRDYARFDGLAWRAPI